jgi:putative intracellular protease/amidase
MKEEIHSGFTSESFPFVLEELLRNRAGTFVSESPWTPYIVKSGQLLTGQNPRSSTILVQALIDRIRAM